ncbi:hypothetical protein ACMGD3_24385 [Lysinibacillus sphaericus]|uniref:hypothetical protein n=1 Tax=Lysinibacillus sphaericus TaxID=1421 RepID=UPI003F7A889C
MIKKIRSIFSSISNIKKYKIEDGEFTKKELFDFLNSTEQYFNNVFVENTPSLEFIKLMLKKDFWCKDDQIPIFFEKLFELMFECQSYENMMLDDYSHDFEVLSDTRTYMTDGERQQGEESIYTFIKHCEISFEKTKSEILCFLQEYTLQYESDL